MRPKCDPRLFELGMPVLGICYGMQLACEALGGHVESAARASTARHVARSCEKSDLFDGLPDEIDVWMSHGDQVTRVSDDFVAAGAARRPARSRPCEHRRCRCTACSFIPK